MARKRTSDDCELSDEHIHYSFIRRHGGNSPSVSSDEDVDVVDDEPPRKTIRDMAKLEHSRHEAEDFFWNEIQPGCDIEPNRLPFNPAGNPGPVFPESFSQKPTELDFFLLLMDEEILADLTVEINRYAAIQRQMSMRIETSIWKDVNVDELKRFFGILLKMGLVQLPAIHEYWATDWYSTMPFFGKAMGRNRFQEIYQNLLNACNDDLDEPASVIPTLNVKQEGNAVENKTQPFITKLVSNFQKYFIPDRNIASDESLIGFKGKLSSKSTSPMKPTKWEVVAKTLTDSKTGYMYNIKIQYSGACVVQTRSELTKSDQSVMDLVTPLFGRGYHVFCNRLYTSPHLAKTLLSQQTHLTGMMMNSCYGLTHKSRTGPSRAFRNESQDTLVVQWNDKRQMTMISTYCSANEPVIITRKNGETVEKPSIVALYHQQMSGVDLHDQLNGYYSCGDRKTLKWWKKVFLWGFEVAFVNSFILYNEYHKTLNPIQRDSGDYSTNLKTFRKQLVARLIPSPRSDYNSRPGVRMGVGLCDPSLDSDEPGQVPGASLSTVPHFIGKREKSSRICAVCNANNKKKETVYYCKTCPSNPYLHIPDCFNLFHEELLKVA